MPFEIHDEIAISRGPLKDWICGRDIRQALILEEEVDDRSSVNFVLTDGYGENLTDSDLEKIGRDPFLIAYALCGRGPCGRD